MKTEETFEEAVKAFKEKQEMDRLRIGRLEFMPDTHGVIWRLEYIMKMLLNAHELNDSRYTRVMNEVVSLREEVIKRTKARSRKRKLRTR